MLTVYFELKDCQLIPIYELSSLCPCIHGQTSSKRSFHSSRKGFAEGLCVKDKIVYLANGNEKNIEENGMFIIDAHHPDSLVIRGKCTFPGWLEGVCLAGNYIFITNTDSGVRSINISNPENPRLIDHLGPIIK